MCTRNRIRGVPSLLCFYITQPARTRETAYAERLLKVCQNQRAESRLHALVDLLEMSECAGNPVIKFNSWSVVSTNSSSQTRSAEGYICNPTYLRLVAINPQLTSISHKSRGNCGYRYNASRENSTLNPSRLQGSFACICQKPH